MYIVKKNNNKHLLILIHGLSGSKKSWMGHNSSFVSNLIEENIVRNFYDISIFEYHTSISPFRSFRKYFNLLIGFFCSRPKEKLKGINVGINKIGSDFEYEIRESAKIYESISIIAHSMGGLVTKVALSKLDSTLRKKVKLFVSLSVPHIGSRLAKVGENLLGNNPQIRDLQAMGEFVDELSQRFANLGNKPQIYYQSGSQDDVVPSLSAIPSEIQTELTARTSDTHFSVLEIHDRNNNTLFRAIINKLSSVLQPFVMTNLSVPSGVKFKDFIEVISPTLNIRVKFEGFTDNELNIHLRAGDLTCSSVEEFFNQLKNQTVQPIREFEVKSNNNNFDYILRINNNGNNL